MVAVPSAQESIAAVNVDAVKVNVSLRHTAHVPLLFLYRLMHVAQTYTAPDLTIVKQYEAAVLAMHPSEVK